MTRYPKGGRGKKWTNRELQSIPAEWKGDTLSDGDGLVGEVRSTGGSVSVAWRYGFKADGRKRWFYAGAWPTVDMADIRKKRDDARAKVKAGIDPNVDKVAVKIEAQAAREAVIAQAVAKEAERKTVQDLFDAWIIDGVARKDGNSELKRLFSKDVLPEVGTIELRKLTADHLLALLRKMRARGVIRQVVLAFGDISQMLHWGEKRQPWRGLLIDGNPADLVDIDRLLPADYEPERDRVLSPAEIRELATIFAQMDDDYANAPDKRKAGRPVDPKTRVALWICLGTLCRIGELLMAEWGHVDLDAGTWFIPAANTKGQRGKRQDHYVFLSHFATRQFKALHAITGESAWLFPASNPKNGQDVNTHVCVKSVSKQVGDRQEQFKNRSKPPANRRHDNSLVLAGGANGEWTPHDLRRTGATMMQGLGVTLDIIDRCQNHVLPGKVRRVYLRHDYQVEKTEAWKKLGDRLEAILAGGADIVDIRQAS